LAWGGLAGARYSGCVNQPAPVHLILGEDDFLTERARRDIIDAIKKTSADPGAVGIITMRASDLTEGEVAMHLSPSLFGEERILVITNAEDTIKDAHDALLLAARNDQPGIYVIIQHTGKGRAKNMVKALSKLGVVHDAAKLNASQRGQFVTNEFRRHNVRPTPDVTRAILEGVGSDLRELAAAISQLVADTGGDVTVDHVRTYFTGVAEVSGFDIADLACNGETQRAIASTRRALQLGIDPIVLAAALGGNIAAIARLYSARSVGEAKDRAGVVKMPPWKIESTYKKARRWDGDNISKAVIIIAELDAATKGQGGDPGYAIENAVRQIAELAP